MSVPTPTKNTLSHGGALAPSLLVLLFCTIVASAEGSSTKISEIKPAARPKATAPPTPARSTPTTLASFGTVLWQKPVTIGPNQDVCIGDQFYGPGVVIDFGIVQGRFKDRIYFRTDRKIVREWEMPSPGQPDSARAWADTFVKQFAAHDTLFAELHDTGEPVVATGNRAIRMGRLFRKWVSQKFGQSDYKEAADLGVPIERLTGPPPERICPLGEGGG